MKINSFQKQHQNNKIEKRRYNEIKREREKEKKKEGKEREDMDKDYKSRSVISSTPSISPKVFSPEYKKYKKPSSSLLLS